MVEDAGKDKEVGEGADELDNGGAAAWRSSRGTISQAASDWEAALVDPAVRSAVEAAAGEPALSISICYARPDGLWTHDLRMPLGSLVAQALWASGFLTEFPNFDISQGGIGVFGHLRGPYEWLQEGDRLEVYRTLHFDPQESRFRRVEHKAKLQRQQKSGRRS
jgi:putative ubiquitin-RnfH superfamily antitoxin RatB of RatAB toxin-antitoxin module